MTQQEISKLFMDHGLRCTRQRHAIYTALSQTCAHPTADDLYQTVASRMDDISLATVYNTLEVFCCAGMARRLPAGSGNGSGSGGARYDALEDETHLHLRCQCTGEVHDLPVDLSREILGRIPQSILDRIEADLGFKVHQVEIELVGEKAGAS